MIKSSNSILRLNKKMQPKCSQALEAPVLSWAEERGGAGDCKEQERKSQEAEEAFGEQMPALQTGRSFQWKLSHAITFFLGQTPYLSSCRYLRER